MSSLKDDERMKRKLGGNPAAAAFVSPFASNSNSDNDSDDNNKIDADNNINIVMQNNIHDDNDVASNSNNNDENDSVINDNSNNDNDINNNVASNNDININNDVDIVNEVAAAEEPTMSTIDALLEGNKKAPPKVFKGFYLDPDVSKVLDRLAKRQGKGIQSQVVNEALRMVFVSKGLM